MRLLLRHTIDASPALNALFLNISRDMHLSQSRISRTRLLVLPGLASPATAGWWTPRILLPEVCEQIGPTPQVADVLCHELVHVARRDYLWAGLSDLICCLLFFHPAAWKACKAMALQGELACDQEVLEKRPGDRADYAGSLTYFVRLRMLQEGFSLGVDFAASASLGLRIRTILTAPKTVPWWKRVPQMTGGLALVAAFGMLAPAVTILLGFAGPVMEQSSATLSAQPPAKHTSNTRHVLHRAAASSSTADSLTTLRVQSYVPETPAYTMTSGANAGTASVNGEQDSPVRGAPPIQSRPSVSSVIRSTLGDIAIATRGAHGGRRDKDEH